MKILYLLSAHGKGSGGHFHSLNNISKSLHGYKNISIKIASIGNVTSPVLKDNPNFLVNLEFKWYSFFTLNNKFRQLLNNEKVDIVHCYDGGTALIIMMLPFFWKTHIVHTKCGGPNERSYIAQFLPNVILFSKENLNSLIKNKRFNKASIYLIPNRVFGRDAKVENLDNLIKKDFNCFTFLRIARIGKTYKDSIIQSINLVNEVYKVNKSVKLIIIGVIEDEFLFKSIEKYANSKNAVVIFLTDKKYTSEASRFLYIADAVIGTGRGVMEAMVLGIPVYAPLKNRMFPAFINNDTFEELFYKNFSQRNTLDWVDDVSIVNDAIKLVNDVNYLISRKEFTINISKTNFLITEEIKSKYYDIYTKVITQKRKWLIFKNILPIVYYLNSYRIVAKRT